MKKLVVFFSLILLISTFFSSCAFSSPYELEEKVFEDEGLSITLSVGFEAREYEGYNAAFEASSCAVFTVREDYAVFEELGYENMTLEQFARLVCEENDKSYPTEMSESEGLTVLKYSYTDGKGEQYRFYTVITEGDGAFWEVIFMCKSRDYAEYEPYFAKWAGTIKFSED